MLTHNNYKFCVYFNIFECPIAVHSDQQELISILRDIYGNMEIAFLPDKSLLSYTIKYIDSHHDSIIISRQGIDDIKAEDLAEFLYLFEKDMTIELQILRADLLFVHSAALEYKGKGVLIVAPSGTGKSTTTWALIHNGFKYLSDELAPIAPDTFEIKPYPHALCLKSVPPMYTLPDNIMVTRKTIHVHDGVIDKVIQMKDVKLKVILFLDYEPDLTEPIIVPITNGESAAMIYANALNILSHSKSDFGLHTAVHIAQNVQSFRLKSNQLDKTCLKIKQLLETLEQ